MPSVTHIHETCLYGGDLRAMERFYSTVLRLKKVSELYPRGMAFRVSRENMLLIFDPAQTAKPNTTVPSHGAVGPGHVAFACADADFEAWRGALVSQGIEIEREAQWNEAARSMYFRDPAGNSVEIKAGDEWGDGA